MTRLKPYGPRGVAMLALAILAFGRALAYTQPASPTFAPAILIDLNHIIPTWVWGILWGATGVYVVVGAYRKRQVPALALIAGMSTLWALIYVWAAIARSIEFGAAESVGPWITATVYMALTVIIGAMTAMINVVERVGPMSDTVAVIVAFIGLIGSVGGTVLVVRRGRKSDQETNSLAAKKDAREDRESMIEMYRVELKERDDRLDRIDARLSQIAREFRISINYIEQCLLWERRGSKPPKPPIPGELHGYLDPALIREHQRLAEDPSA